MPEPWELPDLAVLFLRLIRPLVLQITVASGDFHSKKWLRTLKAFTGPQFYASPGGMLSHKIMATEHGWFNGLT